MVSRKQRLSRPEKTCIRRMNTGLGPVDLMHARYLTQVVVIQTRTANR